MWHVMFEALSEPFHYAFMQHAFLAGTCAAILSSLVGFFIVVRQAGFAVHALGHVGFTGACAGMLLGMSPLWGQLLTTVLVGFLMSFGGSNLAQKDTMIGVTLAFALGVGLLLLHFYHAYSGQANAILFGDLLGVSTQALYGMAALTLIGVGVLILIARPLWFSSLTPALAEARCVPLWLLSMVLFVLMAFAITLASQVVGVLLVFTLFIGPAAIALEWCLGFWTSIGLSVLLGVLLVWIGIGLSYYTDWPISFWISTFVLLGYCCSVWKRRARS